MSTLVWDDCAHEEDEAPSWVAKTADARVLCDGSAVTSINAPAAALATPIMHEGLHHLTFAVRGDCVVGLGAVDLLDEDEVQWDTRTWGLSTATGCLHHGRTATDEGMLGVELGEQRMIGDSAERILHFEVDCDASSLRLRVEPHPWLDVPVSLPDGVRPWALLSAEAADVPPTVRLLACEPVPVPLHMVEGLAALVGHLRPAEQRRALEWCLDQGTLEVGMIRAVGGERDFVDALGCRKRQAQQVLRRL